MSIDVRRWLAVRLVALANWIGGGRWQVGFMGGTLRTPPDYSRGQVTVTYADDDAAADRIIRKIEERLRRDGSWMRP